MKAWTVDTRLPPMTLERAFTHYIDICTTPSHTLLEQFALLASDPEDSQKLQDLAKVGAMDYILSIHLLLRLKRVTPQTHASFRYSMV